MTENNNHEIVKHLMDWLAAFGVFGWLFNVLPWFVTLMTGVWTAARLYEMFTGKQFSESAFAKFITRRAK